MTTVAKRIGFTTSLPVEVILAAGHIPVDLNNLFIKGDTIKFISEAEQEGFPRNICSWIKGIYTIAQEANLDEVIGVTQGDCSNTHSLMAMLSDKGMQVYGFAFPAERNYSALDEEIRKLEEHFGVTRKEVNRVKERLDAIRRDLLLLDEMTWKENLVMGEENHSWLVSASDFNGNPDKFDAELKSFLRQVKTRKAYQPRLRLAYLGVPPIFHNLHEVVHSLGGEIIYNEIQRQFAMLSLKPDLVEQYLDYTYPYTVFDRIKDIQVECEKRSLQAVISYTQAFCHRQIDNILLKKYIKLPFLTLEGDQPGELDSRTLLRLESFMEIHGEKL
ncbi:MAG TPA: 2-hydroxyacyl-CoA dehydratase [Candidatus Cloacimonadota bacterium]|nr:2-hydroxyacyl-CoA dehydratase [Candidatus Cloacimonadota bacterium]HQL14890.1 2-hydroxyacyl-CoA dehydratase [Candidatus Cloacimonadota bacterium]